MPQRDDTPTFGTGSAGGSGPGSPVMQNRRRLCMNSGVVPRPAQAPPVQRAARHTADRPVLKGLSRVVCVALTVAALVAGSSGASFAADLPAQELTDWDISTWSDESVAACAVVLTKAGYLGSEAPDGAADLGRLTQGLALDALSKAADPELNRVAWATPVVNLRNDAHAMMQLDCADLFKGAAAQGLIPKGVLTAAHAKAAAYMTANGLSP